MSGRITGFGGEVLLGARDVEGYVLLRSWGFWILCGSERREDREREGEERGEGEREGRGGRRGREEREGKGRGRGRRGRGSGGKKGRSKLDSQN